ncbi:adenosine receptor A1-like [Esox lucius]|uniref:adenosine receptor A1-like n=1 Tax=Esox lucius TaxID=8010 RepID=UPI001477548C|nr:adenosine receptor A1-like [Esox lucius]
MASVLVMVVSVRMSLSGRGTEADGGGQGGSGHAETRSGSVSACLKLCLGWVGAVGGALGVPVSVLLNLRSNQCLYTCLTLVCCPLLVRQFTVFLLLLLSLDSHLMQRLGSRYSAVVTHRRALFVVLLCWVASVISSFAQFIGWNVLDTWGGAEGGLDGLGLEGIAPGNRTSVHSPPRPAPPKYNQDRSVIGKYLPYGGFLSRFYVEDLHNFTYAEIHGSHWGVCSPDTVLSPHFLVYVYGVTVFLLPLMGLLAIYLDLVCLMPRLDSDGPGSGPQKHRSSRARSLGFSLCLLIILCLPLHITHSLLLYSPGTLPPTWASSLVLLLFQLYGLVPPLLFTTRPPPHQAPRGSKAAGRALCSALRGVFPSLKRRVCPEVCV